MKPQQWRRSSAGRYLRHLPRIKHIRGTWLHRRLGERFFAAEMWHPDRRRFAAGAAIGTFFGMIPLPIQMLGAAVSAYAVKANIPSAIAFTWMSNPLTMGFFMYLQYKTGAFLMGQMEKDVSITDVFSLLKHAPIIMLVGSVVVGIISGLLIYPVALFGWDWFHARALRVRKMPAGVEKPKE